MFIQETSLGIVSILVYTFLKETKAFSIRELVLYKKHPHFCILSQGNLKSKLFSLNFSSIKIQLQFISFLDENINSRMVHGRFISIFGSKL